MSSERSSTDPRFLASMKELAESLGLGFRVWGWGLGFRVWGLRFGVFWVLGFRVWGLRLTVSGSGFKVSGFFTA